MNKTYAFSDLHGNLDLWKHIQNFLDDSDMAFCLGDCCDRGLYGIKIMQDILNDSRITYLQGNHERMFLNGIAANGSNNAFGAYDYLLWMHNGGSPTADLFYNLPDEEQVKLYDEIYKLKYSCVYINKNNKIVFLSHAGCQPSQAHLDPATETKYDYLWNRNHIDLAWDKSPEFDDLIIVHGHTPVQYIMQDEKYEKILKYCNNHKIDIDIGAYVSNVTVLLDLDTFEPIYFNTKGRIK